MCKKTGFTLIELIMVIVILSIMGVILLPKFWDNSAFQARGFADQVLATLRYAQKSAIAQHQNVCVDLSATTLTLKIVGSSVPCTTFATPLYLPDKADDLINGNILKAQGSVTLNSTAPALIFNPLGQANTYAEITISGITSPIFIEKETGYVHQ